MRRIVVFIAMLLAIVGAQAQQITRGELFEMFHNAQKAQKENRIGDAIAIYKEITTRVPALPEPYLALGVLYSVNEDNPDMPLAIEAYKKYIELAPAEASTAEIKALLAELENEAAQTTAQAQTDDQEAEDDEELLPDNEPVSETIEDDADEIDSDTPASQENVAIEEPESDDETPAPAVAETQDTESDDKNEPKIIVIEDPDDIYVPQNQDPQQPGQQEQPQVKPSAETKEEAGALNEKDKKDLVKKYKKEGEDFREAGNLNESLKYYELAYKIAPSDMELVKILAELYSISFSKASLEKSRALYQTYIEKIDFGHKNYDIVSDKIQELDFLINNYSKDQDKTRILKSVEGVWISSKMLSDSNIPIWAFNIKCDGIFSGIELHKGSERYSDNTYSNIQVPLINDDNTMQVRFVTGGDETPSITEYVIESIYLEVTEPDNAFLGVNEKPKGGGTERKKRFEQYTNLAYQSIGQGSSKTTVNKTFDEFILKKVSDNCISAICIETSYRIVNGEATHRKDSVQCQFYRLPNNQPVVFLGKNSYVITGNFTTNQQTVSGLENVINEYNKFSKRVQAGKSVNYTKLKYSFSSDNETLAAHMQAMRGSNFLEWHSKATTKSRLKFMGGSLLSVASVAAGVAGLGSISNDLIKGLSETLYNSGRTTSLSYISNAKNMLSVNPSVWNKNMYNSLVQSHAKSEKMQANKNTSQK